MMIRCPKCRADLAPFDLDGLPASSCTGCKGLWLAPEFVEKAPLDPLTGKPFRYSVTASGIKLWGVGCNLVDDGGTTKIFVGQGDCVWERKALGAADRSGKDAKPDAR